MPTYYPPGSRKGNRYYVVRGSVAGIEHEITTRTRDKRAAEKLWRDFADAARERSKSSPRALETFEDVADAYLSAAARSKRERGYVERLKRDAIGALAIAEVRQSDVHAAARRLYPTAKPQTQNRQAVAPAAAILHFAATDGLRDYIRVERFKETEPETRRPQAGAAEILIANTEGAERRLLVFLFFQGWRITETLSLKWEHVRLPERLLRVYVGKAGRWKDVPMTDAVFEALAEDPRDRGYVFPWRSRSGVYKWLRPLRARLGVTFTPHMARHDFGGQLREAGATPRDLVDVGTWTSEKSTARYQHAGAEHNRQIIGRRRVGDEPGEITENSKKSNG